MEDLHEKIAERIINEQETLIGSVAYEQARKVAGLKVDAKLRHIKLEGNKKDILEKLVEKYKALFGQTSVEVCKEAVKDITSKAPKDQVPQILL